jgi:hypothetical protein
VAAQSPRVQKRAGTGVGSGGEHLWFPRCKTGDVTGEALTQMGFQGEVSSARLRLARHRPGQPAGQGGGQRDHKTVARSDRVLAGEGVVSLMERLWPALEHIDTSSGALGGAVYRTLGDLIPIMISTPADVATRSLWLERLFRAVMDDGVQYLAPVEERWGEIAVYPELMEEHAERLRGMIRRVWVEEPPGGHVVGRQFASPAFLRSDVTAT